MLFSCEGAALEVLMSVCPSVVNVEGSRKFQKAPKVYRMLQKVTEGPRKFQKVAKGPRRSSTCAHTGNIIIGHSCSYSSLHPVTVAWMQLQ